MIYPYRCKDCANEFEIIKAVADIDREETCPLCNCVGERYISQTHFYGASDWHGAEYNPGLGCVVNSKKHQREICRHRGLEEIGSESPESLHRMQERSIKEKTERNMKAARDRTVEWINN